MKKSRKKSSVAKAFAWNLLRKHFRGFEISQLVTSSRSFPVTARVDLQKALADIVDESAGNRLIGLHEQWGHETLTIAKLWSQGDHPVLIGPLQYEEVDVGEREVTRCLKQALWLGNKGKSPFAVVLTPDTRYGRHEGTVLEIAIPPRREWTDIFARPYEPNGKVCRGRPQLPWQGAFA
jgi:hypothetical protein